MQLVVSLTTRNARSLGAQVALAALLSALVLGSGHHYDTDHHHAAPTCAVCVVAHHQPAVAAARVLPVAPVSFAVHVAERPTVVVRSVAHHVASGRAPPSPEPVV
jgi:hypothetical protein